LLEFIGWLGSVAFGICGLPQALKSIKDGHSDGISWGFIFLWLIGEICTLIYVLPQLLLPLILNYVLNLVFLIIIIFYKFKNVKYVI
jgi:uncharacterized protein with PQ loop repeat